MMGLEVAEGTKFKLEAVKLVGERGVSAAQAARDLDLHADVLQSGRGVRG
jgi:transposase